MHQTIRGDKALRVSPADPNLVLFSSSSNTLYRTTNGFTTTETVLTAADRVHDIEFAPSDPNIVYAATGGYSVYRSDDGGASFTLLVNLRTDGIIN
jgi:exopolysaccharide biosynthesis predicted pyruvyltransferase EpsI